MSKWAFIIFNICFFFFDYIMIPYLPNPLIFGWLPLQAFALFVAPILAAVVWGYHFNRIY